MARSVVKRGTERCPHCRMAPRWCVCAGARAVALPFTLDVFMNSREAWKPTSTGNLILRVVPGARRHIFHNQRPLARESVCLPGRTTWVLHPRGAPLDEVLRDASPSAPPSLENLQVIVIDGTWKQAGEMLRHVDGWGQKVSLPFGLAGAGANANASSEVGASARAGVEVNAGAGVSAGESRYWLRSQHHPSHVSTIEAVMLLLKTLGCVEAHDALRVQFELHVYASLLSRGHKADAEEFLSASPLREALPEVVRALQVGRA